MSASAVGSRLRSFFLAAIALSALAGCTEHKGPVLGNARYEPWIPIFPDTGSMNAQRFGDETYPEFWREPEPVIPEQDIKTSTKLKTALFGYPVKQEEGLVSRYAAMLDDGRAVNAIPAGRVDARFFRQTVDYPTNEKPGTLVIDRARNFLYLVEPGGKALRYGVGLGRQGVSWSGRGVIKFKRKWPHWTPSDNMVDNDPALKTFSAARGGLVAGTYNPLGARALYIYRDGKDTLYRVHGTPDWQSVGKKTSSGCVRMFNQDVIDLYDRVRDGAEIVVL
ncbi:L,D-transpeptidase [Rhizobium sp. L1K21]|uniref:L,D-transpeptidase n=1 Tax=Rhizobium sp. L1K21 TaxID=2954933 RepID=UPI00209211D3|nr:L,D-transpeptidase [Rhizobium sp. L1K21]MCO6185667.1 L,D-transpeptidase [Rhizobium sp. L1K21]